MGQGKHVSKSFAIDEFFTLLNLKNERGPPVQHIRFCLMQYTGLIPLQFHFPQKLVHDWDAFKVKEGYRKWCEMGPKFSIHLYQQN